jgi:hypothetical protein
MEQDKIRAEIVWQIASYPGIRKRSLAEQARNSLNISNDAPLENQLKWLMEKDIIYNESANDGLRSYPGSYYICQTYKAFTYSYELFKKRKSQKEFLKTIYYIEYTSSRDFLSKILLNIFKNSLLELNDYIEHNGLKSIIGQVKSMPLIVTAEEWKIRLKNKPASMPEEEYRRYLQEIDELEAQAHKKFLRNLHSLEANDVSDEFVNDYKRLIGELKNNDVDALPAVMASRLGQMNNISFGPCNEFLADYMLPDFEQANISLMLSLSPSAIEYALNPKYPSPSLLASLASLMLNSIVPPGFFRPIVKYDIETLYNGDVSSIYSVIKSIFISDLMNDRLIVKKGAENLINEIFSKRRTIKIINVPEEYRHDKRPYAEQ